MDKRRRDTIQSGKILIHKKVIILEILDVISRSCEQQSCIFLIIHRRQIKIDYPDPRKGIIIILNTPPNMRQHLNICQIPLINHAYILLDIKPKEKPLWALLINPQYRSWHSQALDHPELE
jgi:hypothetical protein